MTGTRTIGRFGLIAAMLVSCAIAQAMDLRDMPDWVRERIWPVEIDWQAMGSGQPAEVTGVHIFGTSPAVTTGTQTASPVNFGAPTVTTPGGGAVTVGAPGLATGGGVHVPGFEGDAAGATGVRPATAMGFGETGGVGVRLPGMGEVGMAGGVGVRPAMAMDFGDVDGATMAAPGMGEVGVAGGVHVEAMGAEWDEALTSIEGLDRETLAQAGQILAMIREKNMSPEEFAAWAKEHQPTPEVLTAGVTIAGRDWRTAFPRLSLECMALCAGLHECAGRELSRIEIIPLPGRCWLGMYLARTEEPELAVQAIESIDDQELQALPRTLVHLASSHMMWDYPHHAIRLLRRYASVLGEQRLLSLEMMISCAALGKSEAVRDELIPFAQAGLRSMPPTDSWDRALAALVWGRRYLGQHDIAVKETEQWFASLESLGVDVWCDRALPIRTQLALSLEASGNAAGGAAMLQRVLSLTSHISRTHAVAKLVLFELVGRRPDLAATHSPAGELRHVGPRELTMRLVCGGRAERRIIVTGDCALQLGEIGCDLAEVTAFVKEARRAAHGVTYEIDMTVVAGQAPRTLRGELTMRTNDPRFSSLRMPVFIECASAIAAPPIVYFGEMLLGETKHVSIAIMSSQAIRDIERIGNHGGTLSIDWAETTEAQSRLDAQFTARKLGTVEGTLHLYAGTDGGVTLRLPYFAYVSRGD